jgi:ribonuclease-3 family protein
MEEKIIWDKDIFTIIQNNMNLEDISIETYSPLTLAYIGDAIYELVIRTIMVDKGNKAVNKLHKETANLVKAETQATFIHLIEDILTQEELAVYKRGRNAKSFTKAKNASVSQYRHATGFEALMGWLYLTKNTDRMLYLIGVCLERFLG